MQQKTALKLLKSGENVFITGSAGTGKTYLLNLYIDYLKERRVYPTVVAPTGIAASHLKGQTIHSYFSLGIRESIDDGFVDFLRSKKHIVSRFSKLKILIIDEISMVSPELFSSMDKILRGFKNSTMPFGGVQVVLSGDFFQLPPVSKEYKEKLFAWQSPVWRELELKSCYLSEKFRQSDERLISILDDIRSGNISGNSHVLLESRREKDIADGLTITKLYTHNIDVDRINQEELEKLPNNPVYFTAESKGSKSNIEKIFKSSLVLEELTLKKNALVICIKNNPERGYVNGSTGIITGFDSYDSMPIVRLTSGSKVKMEMEDWSLENDSGVVSAKVTQIPLRLAWAITIHKSQGMTLDSAEIDLSKTFERGQGYVALSRIKSIDGLRLIGINEMALEVNPLTLRIDDRIKSASDRASNEIESISKEQLHKLSDDHIVRLGGTIDKREIDQEVAHIKSGEPSPHNYKTPTHIKTKNLIEKCDSILSIATERGLSKGTIISHLSTLKKEDEALDLSKFKDNESYPQEIIPIVNRIKEDKSEENFTESGELRLKPIFDALDGEVSYDDIRLALLFL